MDDIFAGNIAGKSGGCVETEYVKQLLVSLASAFQLYFTLWELQNF
jgi:hypothetical protein